MNAFNTQHHHNHNSITLNSDKKSSNDNRSLLMSIEGGKSRNLSTKLNVSPSEKENKIPCFFSPVSTIEIEEEVDLMSSNDIKKTECSSTKLETNAVESEAMSMNKLELSSSSSSKSNNENDVGDSDILGLLARSAVAMLRALWASNFSAAKLSMAESGV